MLLARFQLLRGFESGTLNQWRKKLKDREQQQHLRDKEGEAHKNRKKNSEEDFKFIKKLQNTIK